MKVEEEEAEGRGEKRHGARRLERAVELLNCVIIMLHAFAIIICVCRIPGGLGYGL